MTTSPLLPTSWRGPISLHDADRTSSPIARPRRPFAIALEGPSCAGKTTLWQPLARALGATTVPEVPEFLPNRTPTSEAEATENEVNCLRLEVVRCRLAEHLLAVRGAALFDRSFLSTLAVAYGYATEYGDSNFVGLCRSVIDLLASGELWEPDAVVLLECSPAEIRRRNRERVPPLDEFFVDEKFVERQLQFYDDVFDGWPGVVRVSAEQPVDEVLRTAAGTLRTTSTSALNVSDRLVAICERAA